MPGKNHPHYPETKESASVAQLKELRDLLISGSNSMAPESVPGHLGVSFGNIKGTVGCAGGLVLVRGSCWYNVLLWYISIYFYDIFQYTSMIYFNILLWYISIYFYDIFQYTFMICFNILLWYISIYFYDVFQYTFMMYFNILLWCISIYFYDIFEYTFMIYLNVIYFYIFECTFMTY